MTFSELATMLLRSAILMVIIFWEVRPVPYLYPQFPQKRDSPGFGAPQLGQVVSTGPGALSTLVSGG